MKKFIYVILFIFLIILSGCSSSYTLIIDDNSFKEEINIQMENNIYKTTPIEDFKQYPFYNSTDEEYEKKIVDNGNYKDILLTYSYSPNKFADSTVINTCFDQHAYSFNNNQYDLLLSGKFKCLYGDSIDINIKTNNKVLSHNADNVNGNTYTWHIDQNNKNNVLIEMKIKKGGVSDLFIGLIVAIVIGIIGFIVLRTYKQKNSNRNDF